MKHVILMNFSWRIISHTAAIQAERRSTNGIPAKTVEKCFLTRDSYDEFSIVYICIKRCVKINKRQEAHLNLSLSYCFHTTRNINLGLLLRGFLRDYLQQRVLKSSILEKIIIKRSNGIVRLSDILLVFFKNKSVSAHHTNH